MLNRWKFLLLEYYLLSCLFYSWVSKKVAKWMREKAGLAPSLSDKMQWEYGSPKSICYQGSRAGPPDGRLSWNHVYERWWTHRKCLASQNKTQRGHYRWHWAADRYHVDKTVNTIWGHLKGEARALTLPELTLGVVLIWNGLCPEDGGSLRQGYVCLNLYCTPSRLQNWAWS